MNSLPFDTNLANPDLMPDQKGPPHDLFRQWRERDPVHWNPPPENYVPVMPGASLRQGFWVLTRYQDVAEVSRDQKLFSSHEGSPIIWDFEPDRLLMQQAGMMGMPHEQHLAMKRLVMPPFGPKPIEAFEPEIRRVAKQIIDDVAGRGECEFVFDVASRLPVFTFCKIMGIPEDYRERVFRLGNALADTENPKGYGEGGEEEEGMAVFQLFALSEELCEQKRAEPDGSILSSLIHEEVDGEKLTQDQINMFFIVVAIAGHETTRGSAVHFIRLMNEHPDQYEIVKSDPEKYLPNAIDEVLRHSPPVVKFRRTVTRDTEIGGQPVKQGDKIYLSYPAANRDPAVFEDPDRFDILRENAGRHLSFGTGPHVCLGSRLARLQLKALLTEIITRIPDIRPAGELEAPLRSIWFNTIMNMPVTFTPERA
ncbi:MAG: cytochrome P450 [Gammaproteobacteria bacterium AqS3]|nr:cytochrome P450 [Gammaproteobacteria bacterium AqS3]